jgi:pimeloyl-ACP methyl ester carboxylesterase
VIISNQSGQHLCGWVDLATTLNARGYEVVLYDYDGPASDNARDVLDYVQRHGPTSVALLGGSQGAKASIVAASHAKKPPEAVVALSGEEYLEGEDVADSAARLESPTLYLTADHDPFDSYSANEQFEKVTPAGLGQLVVVPGADHGIQLLQDAGVEERILAFLDSHLSR